MIKTNLDNQHKGLAKLEKLDDSDYISSEVCDTVRTNNAQVIVKDEVEDTVEDKYEDQDEDIKDEEEDEIKDVSIIDETIDFVLPISKQVSVNSNLSFL